MQFKTNKVKGKQLYQIYNKGNGKILLYTKTKKKATTLLNVLDAIDPKVLQKGRGGSVRIPINQRIQNIQNFIDNSTIEAESRNPRSMYYNIANSIMGMMVIQCVCG